MWNRPRLPILQHNHPLANGLVGAWLCYDGAGNVVHDSSANKIHATGNTPLAWNPGGLNLSGSAQYADCGDDSRLNLTNLSIVGRIYPHTISNYRGIFGKRTVSNGYSICFSNGKFDFYTISGGSGGSVQSNTTITINKWWNFAATRDSNADARMYVNGKLDNTHALYPIGNGANAQIGSLRTTTTTWYFDGVIDYLYIYNRAIAASEVSALNANPYILFKPQKPLSITATLAPPGTTDISITWTDNSEHETGFSLERGVDGGGFSEIATPAADSESYTDSDVDVGHTYTYRLIAKNATLGDSEYSNEASVTV